MKSIAEAHSQHIIEHISNNNHERSHDSSLSRLFSNVEAPCNGERHHPHRGVQSAEVVACLVELRLVPVEHDGGDVRHDEADEVHASEQQVAVRACGRRVLRDTLLKTIQQHAHRHHDAEAEEH